MADSSGATCPAIQAETHAFILKPPPELFPVRRVRAAAIFPATRAYRSQ